MIPFKYYLQIYRRYIAVSWENKKQNIKEWLAKNKDDIYKYFNPDNEKEKLDSSGSNITDAIFGTFIRGGSIEMRDKIYCEDMNRQLHFTKGKLKIINNTLHSIFEQPFKGFSIIKRTNKSFEELAVEINNKARNMLLYFLLLVPVIFIIIMLFKGGSLITYDWAKDSTINTAVYNTPPPSSTRFDRLLFLGIIAVIGMYLAVTLLLSILFSIVMFICLWKFVNENATIITSF